MEEKRKAMEAAFPGGMVARGSWWVFLCGSNGVSHGIPKNGTSNGENG